AGRSFVFLGALQRGLAKNHGAPVWNRVAHELAVFEVLTSICEVDTQRLCVAARSGVLRAWEQTYSLDTEDAGVEAQHGVTPLQEGLVGQVNRVVVPVRVDDDGDVCTVADDEAKVVGVSAGTFVLHNQGDLSVVANIKGGSTEGHIVLAGTRDGDMHGLIRAGFWINGDQSCFGHRSPCLSCNAIGWCTSCAQALVAAINSLNGDALWGGHIDVLWNNLEVVREGTIVETANLTQRNKAPLFITAAWNLECLNVEGRRQVTLGLVAGAFDYGCTRKFVRIQHLV